MEAAAPTTVSLTPTGRVVLGMIRLGRQTGYEMKQLVDVSTRFFWAASYGQIYPELKRLEEQGLVTGQPDPAGGRARTAYSLTPAGERVLDDWLGARDDLVWELRCEGLLKLFFSEGLDREQVRGHMRAMQEHHEEVATRLRELGPLQDPEPGPKMVRAFGVAFNEWAADWWRQAGERS